LIFSKKFDIFVCSFDIDLEKPYFNNKLHFYILTIDKKFFTIEYDIITKKYIYESFFVKLKNYKELEKYLINFEETKINCDVKKIISELEKINNSIDSIMFHYKYYNHSLGFYLLNNDNNKLHSFLQQFNYFNVNKDDFNDFSFDIGINYSTKDCKIISTGFFDYY
jgi:hypothetical protein